MQHDQSDNDKLILNINLRIFTKSGQLPVMLEIIDIDNDIYQVYDNKTCLYYTMQMIEINYNDEILIKRIVQKLSYLLFQEEPTGIFFITKNASNHRYLCALQEIEVDQLTRGNKSEISKIMDFVKIAEGYSKLFNYQISIQYYHRVLNYFRKEKVVCKSQIQSLLNLTRLYQEQNNYVEALKSN